MADIVVFSPDREEALEYKRLLESEISDLEIAAFSSSSEAHSEIQSAKILFGWKFPKDIFIGAQRLQWIHKVSAGVEDVVSNPDIPIDVRITRTCGALIAPRMVEYVLGAIFSCTQKFHLAFENQIEKRWLPYKVDRASGKTVGVAGLGDIGAEIARRLCANNMRVVGWRKTQSNDIPGVEKIFYGIDGLSAFASECDFVVSVLPATPETDLLFSREVFTSVRPGAFFINIGRGNCVDEAALVEAVQVGQLSGAFLDVTYEEPLPRSSPLWSTSGIVITPHVSGPIIPEDVVPFFFDNLKLFRTGSPMKREVDRHRGY